MEGDGRYIDIDWNCGCCRVLQGVATLETPAPYGFQGLPQFSGWVLHGCCRVLLKSLGTACLSGHVHAIMGLNTL